LPDFVKPTFGSKYSVKNGKHPILANICQSEPVPNDIVKYIINFVLLFLVLIFFRRRARTKTSTSSLGQTWLERVFTFDRLPFCKFWLRSVSMGKDLEFKIIKII